MNKILLSLCIIFSGCANTSEIFRTSENTYQVTARATWELGGKAGARAMALKAASIKCESLDKYLNVISAEEDYGHFSGRNDCIDFFV